MPPAPANYLLDANVFIQAHRRHYAFDLCPGFWDCLPAHHAAGRVQSIDKIRDELLSGGAADPLDAWTRNVAPPALFASTQEADVVREYSAMMQWVQTSPHYLPVAKSEFATVADGWLAAYAKAKGYTLTTHEEHDPAAKKKVPLPTLCRHFGVPYCDTFFMLRDLGTRFVLPT
jgi:hypothetical protein